MRTSILSISLALLVTLYAAPSYAELGGSVNKDATPLQTQNSVVAIQASLNSYQLKLPSGTQIKEFTNASGVVVAVSWQGPTLPDLKGLLGNYFDAFVNRADAATGNHRNADLHTDDLVVQSHGQLRAFSGRAYLPKLLPAGFNVNQIQ